MRLVNRLERDDLRCGALATGVGWRVVRGVQRGVFVGDAVQPVHSGEVARGNLAQEPVTTSVLQPGRKSVPVVARLKNLKDVARIVRRAVRPIPVPLGSPHGPNQ